MIKNSKSITQTKDKVLKYFNKSVKFKVNLGRNKFVNFMGKITNVYPALFTISPEQSDYKGKTSFSYSEFMCGIVDILDNDAKWFVRPKAKLLLGVYFFMFKNKQVTACINYTENAYGGKWYEFRFTV